MAPQKPTLPNVPAVQLEIPLAESQYDDVIEDSFPASDPPSGVIHAGPPNASPSAKKIPHA